MGPSEADQLEMLKTIGFESLDELVTSTVPANIRLEEPMELGSHTSAAMSETEALALLRSMADKNKVLKSLIGQGYNETHTPYVILRNMLENPGWYTAYTPYQAEISQGRLEMLLNYQTLVTELTGMEMANASLLVLSQRGFLQFLNLKLRRRVDGVDASPYAVAAPLTRQSQRRTRPRPPPRPCPCASRSPRTARRRAR
jgi:glycine dehydrogenase